MLRAKNQQGHFITLARYSKKEIETLRNREQFFCPECDERVIVRAGPRVIPHFAHRNSSHCTERGGESAYHERGKLLLYNWFVKQKIPTKLEAYLPAISQRPDLLIRTKRGLVAIEYQCATVPTEIIRKRNEGYRRANIVPIWILGAKLFKRISAHHFQINTFSQQFLQQFSFHTPINLMYFCPQNQLFSILHDIIFTSMNRAIAKCQVQIMNKTNFPDLFPREKFTNQQLYKLWQREKRKFRLSPPKTYGKELRWRRWLYNKNMHLEYLPSIIHMPNRTQHFLSVPTWNWQSRFVIEFLHPIRLGEIFTLEHAIRFFRQYTFMKKEAPLLTVFSHPLQEYLMQLCQLQFLKSVGDDRYVKCRPIIFYNHIERSMKGDTELLKSFMYNGT